MAMTIELPALEKADTAASPAPSGRLRRFARPALGLLLPMGLALAWEIIVWSGLSSGRLVPPPTKIFATIMELAKSGELTRHVMATLMRVGLGFGLGVITGTVLGAISGYWGAGAPAARSHRAGAARDTLAGLGAAVHPVARHL
jgi:sulfonate transport system permease protein